VRRVACVALPQIRLEIAREEPGSFAGGEAGPSAPLAVVIARPGGAVKTARDVLGNTRLDVVSREARALGVRSGQTVAAARAKCAALHVRVVAESAVRTGLARVAEVALAFGPSAAFDPATDVVWLEIGGCAHLHGGEEALAHTLGERVLAAGFACRVAIADGPRIASAVARLTPPSRAHASVQAFILVPAGQGAAAVRALPIDALDLEPDAATWLRDLGLRTCGDLQRLPRRSLGTRLGARTKDVMALLGGEDAAPLDPWRPPEVPEERAELEWSVASVEALGFVVRALCDRLAVRLEGRAMAASRIALVLNLDRGLLAEGEAPAPSFELALPVPVARPADLFAVVRTRLEHMELGAPVLAVTLRAQELAPLRSRPLDFFAPEPKAARALGPLVAELAADLGPENVGRLALVDTWALDERTRLAPYGAPTEPNELGRAALEPTRLIPPTRRSLEAFEGTWLIARVEAVEWWRRGWERRDFCAAWDGANVAWIDRHVDVSPRDASALEMAQTNQTRAWVRGWID
jgi:protein ImuB